MKRLLRETGLYPTGYALSRREQKINLSSETEMHHVAVLDHVFLALETESAFLFRALLAAVSHEIVVGDHFGADEAFFEIGMDLAGGLRSGRALLHGPGAVLGLPDREERLKVQHLVTLAREL